MKAFFSTLRDGILVLSLLALIPFAQARLSKIEMSNNTSKDFESSTLDNTNSSRTELYNDQTEPRIPEEFENNEGIEEEYISLHEHENTPATSNNKKLSQRLHRLAYIIEQLESVVQEFESLEDKEDIQS